MWHTLAVQYHGEARVSQRARMHVFGWRGINTESASALSDVAGAFDVIWGAMRQHVYVEGVQPLALSTLDLPDSGVCCSQHDGRVWQCVNGIVAR